MDDLACPYPWDLAVNKRLFRHGESKSGRHSMAITTKQASKAI